ncbi:glycosyltransferase family A protein [Microbacterium deminutum]|uniref:Glycosyltransferase 2-like domain-containing protein n=1 Tax=Microbacterium deminutum TaxID=344164 RepID=A0ABP5BUV2_9MICO
MASPELVSALVPAYNHARYVRECLEALRAQTHRPLELLIGDDGSSDDTVDEIRSFLREHGHEFDRVVFRPSAANRGTAATLNDLLAHARGRYLFLNASDDRAAPRAIATLAAVLDADSRAALAVGDNMIIDDAGERIYWGPRRQAQQVPSDTSYQTWAQYLRADFGSGVFDARHFGRAGTLYRGNHVPNGKLFRRAAVEAVGGWRVGAMEDWDLNFRLACRFRLRFVDEVLFCYRWHDTNTIRNPPLVDGPRAATKAAITDQLRNPFVYLRVMADRDNRSGLPLWSLLRGQPPASGPGEFRAGRPPEVRARSRTARIRSWRRWRG